MIKKGDQFWNDEKTEGYEANHDIHLGQVATGHDFKTIKGDHVMGMAYPDWFLSDVFDALHGRFARVTGK